MPLDAPTIRHATFADFEAILKLIKECNLADYDSPMISASSLRLNWQRSRLSLTRDTWTAFASDGDILGYAELERGDTCRFFPMLYLAPEKDPPTVDGAPPPGELGKQLLHRAEQRALTCSNSAEIVLGTRVSDRNLLLQQVYTDAGYTKENTFLIMERLLDSPPEKPVWPPGIHVRPFKPGQDELPTYLADEEASEDKGYHRPLSFEDWARRMNLHAPSFDPSLWFLACAGQEIAGVALNLYAPETITGWIDHLGVRRSYRQRGLGKALLLHSMAAFYQRGIQCVRLSVDSHSLTQAPRLYQRAGMSTVQQYHYYHKQTFPQLADQA